MDVDGHLAMADLPLLVHCGGLHHPMAVCRALLVVAGCWQTDIGVVERLISPDLLP